MPRPSQSQNKAVDPAGQCPKCGRERTEFGCRVVRIGSYCQQVGLYEYAPGYVIYPEPPPVGPIEQAVITEYEPQIEEASKAVDGALGDYDAAQTAHMAALVELAQSGVKPSAGAPTLVNLDNPNSHLMQLRRVSGRAARKLQETEERLRAELDAAEYTLRTTRGTLNKLEHRLEAERRVAKDADRAAVCAAYDEGAG